jgi:hypothetical protein
MAGELFACKFAFTAPHDRRRSRRPSHSPAVRLARHVPTASLKRLEILHTIIRDVRRCAFGYRARAGGPIQLHARYAAFRSVLFALPRQVRADFPLHFLGGVPFS